MPTLPFAFRDVLHQPVDGVVGVGGVIDRRRVLRPVQRAVHHVVALGAVLAAHVLHHADVAALDDHVGGVVVAVQDRAEVRAVGVAGELRGVVGRARQQDRRALRALRHQDDRVQLHAVAHGDHHLAPDVVEAVGDGLELAGVSLGKAGYWGGASLRRQWFGEQQSTGQQRRDSPQCQVGNSWSTSRTAASKKPAQLSHRRHLAPKGV